MRSRPIEDFWLAADGDDWSPAVVRAQTAMSKHDTLELMFQPRVYRFATALDIFRKISLTGNIGAGFKVFTTVQTGYQYPQLYFYNDTAGIVIHYPTVGAVTGTYSTEPTADAFRPVIRNLAIIGTNTSGSAANHGINAHRAFTLENFSVSNFPGNGIHVHATATSTGASFGNANSFTIREGYIYRIGGNGIFCQGADSNAAIISHVSLNDCGKKYSASTTATTAVTIVADNLAVTGTPTVAASQITATVAAGHNYTAGMYCELVQVDNSVVDVNGDGTVDSEDYVYGLVSGTVASVTATTIVLPYTGSAPAAGTYKIRTGLGANTVAGSTAANGEGRVLWATVASHSFVAGQTVRLGSITQVPMTDGSIAAVYKTTSTLVGIECPRKTYLADGVTSDPDLVGTLADGVGTINPVFAQIYNSSFLQNTYDTILLGPTVNSGLQMFDDSNKSTFVGCYSEGSLEQSLLGPGLVIGGNFDPNTTKQKAAGHIFAGDNGLVRVTRAIECHPELFNNGIISRVGGQSLNGASASFHEWGHTVAYSSSKPVTLGFEDSSSSYNAGYIDLHNDTANGYSLLCLPHTGNNRNPRTPLAPGGLFLGAPGWPQLAKSAGGNTAYTNKRNPISNPQDFGFLGFIENISGTTVMLIGDGYSANITAVADNGGGLMRVTASGHGLQTGDRVLITGVTGTTQANGYGIVTRISASQFDLTTSMTGTYTVGWAATLSGGSYSSTTLNTTFTTSGTSGSFTAGQRVLLNGAGRQDVLGISHSGGVLTVRGGDVSAATSASTYHGLCTRVHAIGYGTTFPASGIWAAGDIIYNTAPSTEAASHWICTTGGESGGTWLACYPNHKAYTVTGSVTRGHMGIIRVPFTAAAAGAQDDITIYNANCPVALRIVQVYAYISTIGTGAATIGFRSASGGGGSALSGTMTTASTGFKSVNTTSTATSTVAVGGSIYLRREDRDCAGEAYIVTMEE